MSAHNHNWWLSPLFFYPHFKLPFRMISNVLADTELTFLLKIHKGVKSIWWRVRIWVFVFMSTAIKSKRLEGVHSTAQRYTSFILHLYNYRPAKSSHPEVYQFLHTIYTKEGKTYTHKLYKIICQFSLHEKHSFKLRKGIFLYFIKQWTYSSDFLPTKNNTE